MSNSTPRRWLVAAPLVLVSALALTACDRNKPGEPPNSTPAPTTAPEPVTPAPAMPTTPGTPDAGSTGTGTGTGTTTPAMPSTDPASTPSMGASSPS
ncbi:hypothetical protein [Paracidovorax wautersii]|uniref:Uncharacterized protein n=1 Tax=Paracidovorax wautersii TaxID=1177982 RepID=A0ABU1I824_9BURK|nr:hypothetical protein [Paracidovorax wautersii]MDR6213371.1 hypothetical protein [Paracidovorax wautersii]